MSRHNFSFKDAFVFGWNKTRQHYWFCFLTFLLVTLIINSVDHVPLLRTVVTLMVALSVVSVSLLIARDHHFTFENLFTPLLSPKKVAKFVLISVLYAIPVILAAVFLFFVPAKFLGLLVILPSIYLAVRFKFFPYVVVENEDATLESIIRKSLKLTEGHFWMVFGFIVLIGLLNVLGLAFFIVGLVVTIPVSIFATAYVYTRLKERAI
jgi:hypothetical protein